MKKNFNNFTRSKGAYPGLQRSLFCGVGPIVLGIVEIELFGVALGGSMFVIVSSVTLIFSGVDIVTNSRLDNISNFKYHVSWYQRDASSRRL